MLSANWPDAHYLIIGERYSRKEESRRFEAELRTAAASGLQGRLHFLGVRTDVDRVLNELTLLAHPARQEPLGRVLLEAAASGTAVVATNVGGTSEIFPPESESARLVPADDAGALAGAMLELLGSESLRDSLSAAARRRAQQAFDVSTAATALVKHYYDVV
jgi:glycosyltransferase involved in cell wall biosynthesis